MSFFFDRSKMESSIASVNVDVKKMPLGQLSKETVLKGYEILCELEKAINKKDRDAMITYSEQFYTNIPHNFGMQKMSLFVV